MEPIKRTVAVLGSTGSIGTQALDVAARHADLFTVVALTAHTGREQLYAQVRAFRPQFAALTGEGFAMAAVPDDLRFCRWAFGREALLEAAALDAAPNVAGSASALIGALQYGSGIISSLMLAMLSDGTPWTMAWVIALFTCASTAIALTARARAAA